MVSAHTRLRQAHDLWHRAAESYPDPDEFVLQINQLITTLRQVTFMLQKQKDKIEDFDSWYEEDWRTRMKGDPLMVWLHDARTTIEKVGDLDLCSTARVEVIADWLDGPYSVFEVPPHVGPAAIAEELADSDLPDRVRREGLLKVERRWVSSDLPDYELTDVCAHGYGVMATILSEAHQRLGIQMQTFGGETHKSRHHRQVQAGGKLPCMEMSRADRTAYVHLDSKGLIELETVERQASFTEAEIARFEETSQAMLVDPDKALSFTADQDPIDVARQVSIYACRVCAHDGFHRPTTLLLDSENNVISITARDFRDQAEKYLSFRSLADDVRREGADTVIHVGEVWEARISKDDLSPDMVRASERQDRQEALAVMVATVDGRERTFSTPIARRSDGAIVLGSTREGKEEGAINASFLPVKKVWAERRAAGAG